jgi:hypothetical protein
MSHPLIKGFTLEVKTAQPDGSAQFGRGDFLVRDLAVLRTSALASLRSETGD